MKAAPGNATLSFGHLVAGIYRNCDRRRAAGIIRFAVNAGLMRIPTLPPRGRHPTNGHTNPTIH